MPASEEPPLSKMVSWAVAGFAGGGVVGVVAAGFTTPPPGETGMRYVAKTSLASAGELAAIAAVFAGTDAIMTNVRGPSASNSALAGCAAGSLLGIRSGSVVNAAYGCGMFAAIQGFAGLSFSMNGSGGH